MATQYRQTLTLTDIKVKDLAVCTVTQSESRFRNLQHARYANYGAVKVFTITRYCVSCYMTTVGVLQDFEIGPVTQLLLYWEQELQQYHADPIDDSEKLRTRVLERKNWSR